MKNINMLFANIFIWCLLISPSTLAQDSSTPETLIKSIYADHRPWDRRKTREDEKAIDFYDEQQMSKYFDSEMIALFQMDLTCQKKLEGICSYDSDPVFFSQDSVTDDGYEVSLNRIKETDSYAEYEAIVHWTGFEKPKGGYVFILNKTVNGWRVSDIQRGEHSRKNSMTSILKEYGFYSPAPPAGAVKCADVASGDGYVISGTHVNLRKEPSKSADKIGVVQIGMRVKIMEVSENCENVQGNSGKWVKILARNESPVNTFIEFKGWVFSAFVRRLDQFERIANGYGFERFDSCYGHSCTRLQLDKSGSFTATNISWEVQGPDVHTVLAHGQTFKDGDIFWFRIEKMEEKARLMGYQLLDYVLVRDKNGKYCFGEDIDYLSGNCHVNSAGEIFPEEEKVLDKKEENKNMKIKNKPGQYSV